MDDNLFIDPDNYSTVSQDYEKLLLEGIDHIQKLSGKQWTDYNFHDPGITILEQICYALTDLGYKSNFKIEDILFFGQTKFSFKESGLLYELHEILPSSPLTLDDFRKLILDRVENIENAWVFTDDTNKMNFSGLLSVRLQLSDNLEDSRQNSIVSKVTQLLMNYRSLSTDFYDIKPLIKDEIKVGCKISLDSFTMGEQVLAELLVAIEEVLSNRIIYHDYEKLMEVEDYPVSDFFTGTFTNKGFIRNSELKEKINDVHISEIRELISNNKGIIRLENLIVYKNDIRIYDDILTFGIDHYPVLIDPNKYFLNGENPFKFYRNDSPYELDSVIFFQIYDALKMRTKDSYTKRFDINFQFSKGRFKPNDFQKYYSIVNELPSVYGLKKDELSSNSSELRRAQVMQLRAYLFLFDQFMANYVSQLTNMNKILSIDISENRTYFYQVPNDFPDLELLLSNKSKKSYQKHIEEILETRDKFYKRKNLILDHFMSRFGEDFDTSILEKTKKINHIENEDESIWDYSLRLKHEYAKRIKNLGFTRNLASNYSVQKNLENNISGIENRIRLKLGIPENLSLSSLNELSQSTTISDIKESWSKKKYEFNKRDKPQILVLPDSFYKNDQVHFYFDENTGIKQLFFNGVISRNFKIKQFKNSSMLLFNAGLPGLPWVNIYRSDSIISCERKIKEIINKFNSLNKSSENMFEIESILLRPIQNRKYEMLIYDVNREILLRSYSNSSIEELEDMRIDVAIMALESKNYNIIKRNNSELYDVVIYNLSNRPIFKSEKSFSSEITANEFIKKVMNYFKGIIDKNKISNTSEIVSKDDIFNQFPEEFEYSNYMYFVFPDWPIRFQDEEIKNTIREVIEEFIPVHIRYTLLFLSLHEMVNFEKLYFNWRNAKANNLIDFIDEHSLKLIQILLKFKSNYEK